MTLKQSLKILTIFFILLLSSFSPLHAKNLKIALSNNHIKQGQTLKIEVLSKKPIKYNSLRLIKKKFRLFSKPKLKDSPYYRYVGYIGISRNIPINRYRLKIFLKFNDNTKYFTRYKIWVKSGHFKKQFITLTPKKEKLAQDTEKLALENKLLRKSFRKTTAKRYFLRPFIMPVKKGRITSEFGALRVYNGKPSWRHSGIDIAKKQNAPIKASNSGKVILTQNFLVHGKSILIDHGLGIISIYNHLNKILVSEGQYVKRGQIIGRMGSSGIATGPHVHWGISVQNVRVDPMFWLKRTFLYD